WGVGTVTAKPMTDRLGARLMFIGAAATEAVTFGILGLLLPRVEGSNDPWLIALALGAGASSMIGYLMFYEGLRLGTVGVVGTLTAAYPVVTVGLSVLILQEFLSAAQALGALLMILSVGILATGPRSAGAAQTSRVAILFSIIGFVAWGIWGFLAKVSIAEMGETNLFLYYGIADGATGLAYLALRRPLRATHERVPRRVVAITAFTFATGVVGGFTLTIAYALGPAALVSPVSGTYPIIAALGAGAVLHERVGLRVIVALACFAAGIALVPLA
ncbi:MAG: hypothetical protein A3K68_07285, partial [Euryarchaeota archaeon RBG_16_68_13]